MIEPISIVIILTTLVLSAFFSGFEIAYVSSNKVHIEILKKQEGLIANILTRLTYRPSKLLATMLVGNNVALVVYGFEMGKVMTLLLPSECTVAYHYFYSDYPYHGRVYA